MPLPVRYQLAKTFDLVVAYRATYNCVVVSAVILQSSLLFDPASCTPCLGYSFHVSKGASQ